MSRLVMALLTTCCVTFSAHATKLNLSEDAVETALQNSSIWCAQYEEDSPQATEVVAVMSGLESGLENLTDIVKLSKEIFSSDLIQESIYLYQSALTYGAQATWFLDA